MHLTELARPGAAMAAALVLAATLAACGDDAESSADDPAATPAGSSEAPTDPTSAATTGGGPDTTGWSACDEVWVAGERLPGGYRGCLDGEEPVKADRFTCESGQWLVTYDDRFWAVVGGDIGEARAKLRNDRNYLADLRVCSG